jgi:hypothetical protein
MDRTEKVAQIAAQLVAAALASGKRELNTLTNGDVSLAVSAAVEVLNRAREVTHEETFGASLPPR